MLILERHSREHISLPLLTRVGLVVLTIGVFADLLAHLESAGHAAHLHEYSLAEVSAHGVAFAGMVLILLGVVVDGVRRTRLGRSTESTTK